ncbi:glycosyltransferase [Massilia sp.]|uniref:glycosyltransferase family protein n=1 Tax=Massilia sp. TaxID=1882437 RepID=UPI00289F3D86|nr:glycosyltransferase [Massilia sp.]
MSAVRHAGENVGLLAASDSASIRYLIEPYLQAMGRSAVLVNTSAAASGNGSAGYHTIVIVRYLPSQWLEPLRAFRAEGGRVVYFMDDDLMDADAAAGLPVAYARKIRTSATRHRADIEALCDEFWVSTPYLAQKYSVWQPIVLQPRATTEDLAQRSLVTVCYHGTASHQAELAWLPTVIDKVQGMCENTLFEVFGDHVVNRTFRNIPRVAVLHPMSWSSYLAYTGGVRRDIALAPLLPGKFNAARGPTKFFDFARMGAVGVYSDESPYRDFIRNGVDGLLVPNDPQRWSETVAELVADPARRERMATAARERALSLAADDQTPFRK